MPIDSANHLLDFISRSPTAQHASANIALDLTGKGFTELQEKDRWKLAAEGKYFVRRNGIALIAFVIGKNPDRGTGMHGVAAHLDSPGLKIKLASAKVESASRTLTVGVEIYGGPILATWVDRPLALAGTVSLRGKASLERTAIFTDRPVAVIPNTAIHLNRDINKGFAYNPQDHLSPIFAAGHGLSDESLRNFLAGHMQVEPGSIMEADLFLVCTGGGLLGTDNTLMTAPRLDDLAMANAILLALTGGHAPKRTILGMFADHEEIGSRTPGGADSTFLESTLKRITFALGGDEVDMLRMAADSFLISADMAHAIHPAYRDKHDPAYAPVLNGGPVIKAHAGMKYTTTADTAARFRDICRTARVPVQTFIPKSDQPTGSTVGPIIAGRLGMSAMDIGNPLWAMHSSMETAGVADQEMMIRALNTFYATS